MTRLLTQPQSHTIHGMDSLENVAAILRHDGRHDLSALLADARVEFQYVDELIPESSVGYIELVDAVIHAPIAACKTLRELPEADQIVVFNALKDTWPVTTTEGIVIRDVSYIIDQQSLHKDLTSLYPEPTGWKKLDRTMNRIRDILVIASTEDHFKEIGVLCREALISVAKEVFDEDQHPPLPNDIVDVSKTDAKRMMGRYLASEISGRSNREIRRSVDSAVDLANKVTHSQSSSYRDAALSAQATFNAIGLITIIAGKRKPG